MASSKRSAAGSLGNVLIKRKKDNKRPSIVSLAASPSTGSASSAGGTGSTGLQSLSDKLLASPGSMPPYEDDSVPKRVRSPNMIDDAHGAEVLMLPPHHTKSLPWCLYSHEADSMLNAYPGTPRDFILMNLLGEFRSAAKAKIITILQLGPVRSLAISRWRFTPPSRSNAIARSLAHSHSLTLAQDDMVGFLEEFQDIAWRQIITSLATLSRLCLSTLVRSLLDWRAPLLSEKLYVDKIPISLSLSLSLTNFLDVVTISPGEIPPASQSKYSVKEQAMLREERYFMALEYIFVTTVIAMMLSINSDDLEKVLNEEESAQLERLAFDYFNKQAEKYAQPPMCCFTRTPTCICNQSPVR